MTDDNLTFEISWLDDAGRTIQTSRIRAMDLDSAIKTASNLLLYQNARRRLQPQEAAKIRSARGFFIRHTPEI